MTIQTSQFWNYKEFESRHYRHEKNVNKVKDKLVGPFYFENPIDAKQFRKFLRETLSLNNTEHLQIEISTNTRRNMQAQKTHFDYIEKEKQMAQKELERKQNKLFKPKNKIIKISIFDLPGIIKSNFGSSVALKNH